MDQKSRPLGVTLLVIFFGGTINLIGDSLNAFLLNDLRTLIGLPIGGVMIWYLVRKGRAGDQSGNAQSHT